jgi:hypothetical protein
VGLLWVLGLSLGSLAASRARGAAPSFTGRQRLCDTAHNQTSKCKDQRMSKQVKMSHPACAG